MTILFKERHVPLILSGQKTQTRRVWKRNRVKVGGEYWASTALYDPSGRFARLRVLRFWEERLEMISEEDARKEGFRNVPEFIDAFHAINGKSWPLVTAVEFEVVR